MEKTILDYDNGKTPYLLIEYYQTLGAITTVSTIVKLFVVIIVKWVILYHGL